MILEELNREWNLLQTTNDPSNLERYRRLLAEARETTIIGMFPYCPILLEDGTVIVEFWEVMRAIAILKHARRIGMKILFREDLNTASKLGNLNILYSLPEVEWAIKTIEFWYGKEVKDARMV